VKLVLAKGLAFFACCAACWYYVI